MSIDLIKQCPRVAIQQMVNGKLIYVELTNIKAKHSLTYCKPMHTKYNTHTVNDTRAYGARLRALKLSTGGLAPCVR